jgi:hypothetical protein
VVLYDYLGDAPPSGWDPYATSGPVEAVGCVDFNLNPGYYGIRVLGSGTVSVEHYGGYGGVSEYGDTITWAIRQNGTVIVSDSWTDPVAGWGHVAQETTYLLIEDVAVAADDVFDVYVTVAGGETWQNVYYRKVGVPWNPSLKVWGDVAPGSGADVEDDPLPPPPTGTTNHQTDPTVNDDGEAGYHVGAVWVNEATGEVFVLVDETDGAAVWVSVTGGGTAVEVLDEGGSLTAALASIDFVGAGVTATNAGGDVTVTIPGGAGLDWFNVEDYGAVHDGTTDDTSAIQDAIDACMTAGGGWVYFPNGIYAVEGALQSTSTYNSQLTIPQNAYPGDSTPPIAIGFLGEGPAGQWNHGTSGPWAPGTSGAILLSNWAAAIADIPAVIAAGKYNAVYPAASFNWIEVTFRNIEIRTPANPKLSGIQMAAVASLTQPRCRCPRTRTPTASTAPSRSTSTRRASSTTCSWTASTRALRSRRSSTGSAWRSTTASTGSRRTARRTTARVSTV